MSARRMKHIRPFYAMEVLDQAYRLQAEGRDIIHLEVGEPDFDTPPEVIAAGCEALTSGQTRYTPALGIPELRQAIVDSYPEDCRPDPTRVAVTPGSSAALLLAFGVLIDEGAEVLLADPGYPCNSNFIHLYGGEPVLVATDAKSNYQLTADLVRKHWTSRTRAVLIASPSNPTGTVLTQNELTEVIRAVEGLGGVCVVDEIYLGLTYGAEVRTALYDSNRVFIINSFSKYFGMTGWRIGWLVSPEQNVGEVNKLAQNVYISANAPAQYAALAALTPPVLSECERRREVLRERRDYLVPALRALGFKIPVIPDGAFYIYADVSDLTTDSEQFAFDVLENTGVAITPGRDFGEYRHQEHVRFSYATNLEKLKEAVTRLAGFLAPV